MRVIHKDGHNAWLAEQVEDWQWVSIGELNELGYCVSERDSSGHRYEGDKILVGRIPSHAIREGYNLYIPPAIPDYLNSKWHCWRLVETFRLFQDYGVQLMFMFGGWRVYDPYGDHIIGRGNTAEEALVEAVSYLLWENRNAAETTE